MSVLSQTKPNVHQIHNISLSPYRFLFTSLKDAIHELQKRRRDLFLRHEVRDHIAIGEGKTILKHFVHPRAVLFRQIATPTHEVLRFLEFSKQIGLDPLILEYYGDKFVSARNVYKRSLGKMPVSQVTAPGDRFIFKYHTVCDFSKVEGQTLKKVTLLNGELMVPFHHRLFEKVTRMQIAKHCIDGTAWFNEIGLSAVEYYQHVFALFIRDGILFENYFSTSDEKTFIKNVIIPAFRLVEEIHGHKPLIVQLLPQNDELNLFWDSYPKKMEHFINASRHTNHL